MSIRRHLLFTLLCCISLAVTARHTSALLPANKTNTYLFIENNGQVTDQYQQPRKDIDFRLALPGATIFIGSGHIHYQWHKGGFKAPDQKSKTGFHQQEESQGIETYRLDIILQGAEQHITPLKQDKSPYYEQYDGRGITASGYRKITYPNIYPGIDWVIYCHNNELKYDFIVHQGADAGKINLLYDGAENIAIEKGGLKVVTPMGNIYENPPYSYQKQTGKTVKSHYRLNGNNASIITEAFSGELVIDPVVDFVTYYGDAGYDIGNAAAADNRGNSYLAGTTSSIANIATVGSHQVALQGQYDGFIVAFDLDGNRKWATYFGGVDFDQCLDAVCDPAGNIYLCGQTSSTSGIASVGAQQPLYGGGLNDGFLMKFRKDGVRVWGTFFGGPGDDAVNNVTCDALGNIFICGQTSSTTGISFNNPHQPNLAGQTDGFVARFTPLGQRQWSTYYGGTGTDAINFNACDLFGNLYVLGSAQSTTGISTPGAHKFVNNSSSSIAFLTKFNIAGTVQWGTYFGGTSGSSPGGIVTDAQGDVYICGSTSSTSEIAAGTGQKLTNAGMQDGFISRFNAGGTQIWGSYFGSAGLDNFTGITITSKGRIYISGTTTSNNGITTPAALQDTLNGANDLTLSEWTINGALVYASYLGGNKDESLPAGTYGSFIEYNFAKVYLGGTTNSTAGLSTPNGFMTAFAGGVADAFLASQIVDTIAYVLDNQFTDTTLCEGQVFNLPYAVTLPFDPPNNFTAVLSDANGNFTNSINIGNVVSNTGGGITCTIPTGTPPGTGYRIRLVSAAPIYTSVENSVNIKIDNIPFTPAIDNGSPGCIGDTLKLAVNNPQNGVSYLWNGPGFNGIAVSVSFNSASPAIVGAYTITPTVGACTGTDAVTQVTVKPTPAITTKGSNAPFCEGETLLLNADSDMPGSTFEWEGPSFSSFQQNPVLANATTANSGLYTVKATFNGCTSKKDTVHVEVKHKPVLTKSSNSPVCETDTLQFAATDKVQQTQYSWTGPEGFNSATSVNSRFNTTHAYAGNYIVSATNNGCTTIDTINIIVKPMPFPVASSNTPICSGERLQLSVTTQHPGTDFNWYGPDDFNKTEQNPYVEHVRYIASGLYRVIADLDGCIQEDTTQVKVTQAPITVITTNSPVYSTQQLFINASNNLTNAFYTWTGPGNFRSNTQNISVNDVSKQHEGYYVLKTEYENCSATDSIKVEVLEFLGYDIFILYPNPNNGEFTLRGVVSKNVEIPITVYDMAGRIMYTHKLKTLNNLLDSKIDLAGKLSSGVYIISIRAGDKIFRKRFTVTR